MEKPPITLQSFDAIFSVTLKVFKSGPNTFFLDMNDSWTEVEAHRYFTSLFCCSEYHQKEVGEFADRHATLYSQRSRNISGSFVMPHG